MKVTLTQGAVINGKLRAPGEQDMTEKEAKLAKEAGVIRKPVKAEPTEAELAERAQKEADEKAAAEKAAQQGKP